MSIRLLIDMNLSPEWVAELLQHGIDAVHWSSVGDPRAADAAIMAWARSNACVIFTHDLDFGTLLAHPCRRAQRIAGAWSKRPS